MKTIYTKFFTGLLDNGFNVSRGRTSNLMKKMGIEALYRKPTLSKPHPGHKTYPYLLKGLTIDRANQVWAIDVTYIPLSKGYVYLVAVMDWASRKVQVVNFRLSFIRLRQLSQKRLLLQTRWAAKIHI